MSIRTHSRPKFLDLSAGPALREKPKAQATTNRARRLLVALDERINTLLNMIWRDWPARIALGAFVAALWGVIAGRWTPRGPLTSNQALWSIAISLLVGLVSGLASRSRWSMIAAPVTFAVVLELTRIRTSGPTVDAIHFSTYGMLALVVGRGFHALLSLAPLALAASMGASLARRYEGSVASSPPPKGGGRAGRTARRSVAVLTSVALIALAAGLARPARTAPIVGSNGKRLPDSIAELRTVNINGHGLAMMIRGHSIKNPVLLFLAGGPGGSEMGAMRNHLPKLEERFTVVTWDQRGTGKSYRALDPTSTLTVASAVDDTVAVTNYLQKRFGQDQIYLAGQSWGSLLGVLALQQQPSSYRAFIGVGQMVSPVETDRIFYDDTLAWARKTGKTDLAKKLVKIGRPPYVNMLDYETALSYEHDVYPYDSSKNSEGEGGFSENFIVDEYALIDQVHLLGAFMDTFSVLWPQVQTVDFRVDAKNFTMSMYFVEGRHEAPGRSIPFQDWFAQINAPIKQTVEFETSGHRPLFEQPDKFVEFMTNTVLAQTAAK
jgi:proline iminopeptidase